jgi:hypothetical protein
MTLTFRRRRHAVKLPHYKVQDLKPLGTNADLTAYLYESGLWQIAQGRLSEIYYYVEDEKQIRKHFYALGHQNETGGWQLFARNFNGRIGYPGLTILNAKASIRHIELFLSYPEYLTQCGFCLLT